MRRRARTTEETFIFPSTRTVGAGPGALADATQTALAGFSSLLIGSPGGSRKARVEIPEL